MSSVNRFTVLMVVLATVTVIALILAYFLLEAEKPEDGYGTILSALTSAVIPNLIATLVTAICALLFADYLYKRHAQKVRARDLSPGVISLAGSWKLRDWRHDYGEAYEQNNQKPDPPADANWYREREAHCKTEEIDDRRWKHSENVRIDQSGDFVEVYFSHHESDLKRRVRYRIEGRILGKVFIGEWREINPRSDVYWFGAVQLHVVEEGDRDRGKAMLGRWTGTHSKGGKIRCGVWEFVEIRRGKQEADWPTGIVDTNTEEKTAESEDTGGADIV